MFADRVCVGVRALEGFNYSSVGIPFFLGLLFSSGEANENRGLRGFPLIILFHLALSRVSSV